MTTARKTQIGLLAIAGVLFVLLFLAPKHSNSKTETQAPAIKNQDANIESFLIMALKNLAPQQKTAYDALTEQVRTSKADTAWLALADFWDKQKRPDFAAFFVEKNAVKAQTSEAFSKAGDRYFYAVRFINDGNEIPALYQSAMRCYQKALEKNPSNTDAKIQLASCYVEGGQDPMKGIALLREVEKTDSNNVKLQLSFAFFSVKSQQWDKAIKRFENVLKIDPMYIEAYLHLADAYEQQGQKEKTIQMLENYASLTQDAMARQEVKKYIEQLKK